jgi:hypothetical protein
MRLPSSPRHAEDDEPHPAAAPTSSRHTRRLLRNRRGLDIQANEGNAAGAPAKLPQGQLLIWSGANSVAWGARFLGPSRDASATSSSSSSSSSQQPNQNQDPTINTAAAVASSSSASEWNNSSSLFIGVIVALIICFYLLCTYQCLRIWLCRKFFGREVGLARVGGTSGTLSTSHHGDSSNNNNSNNANTVLVHEGRVFNLSGDQRRQVLEVIFSESSKVREPLRRILQPSIGLIHPALAPYESQIQPCFFFPYHFPHRSISITACNGFGCCENEKEKAQETRRYGERPAARVR